MRRIELAFLLVGIDGECLQKIFIDASDQIFLVETVFTDLVDFINERFKRLPFNTRIRKKLHRERTSKTLN